MSNPEFMRPQETKNLMTEFTYLALQKELEEAVEKQKVNNLAIGETAGINCDWHDNAAFDLAREEASMQNAKVKNLQERLRNVELITSRKEVDEIQVGNTVLVKFLNEDDSEIEKFTILGPSDTKKREGWVSNVTPLGMSLLGHKKGEVVQFEVGENINKIKIVDILPGEF